MNCELYEIELEDYLYGELDVSRLKAISGHLAKCASCAARLDELERENEFFRNYYEQVAIEPSAYMWETIRARITVEQGFERFVSASGWFDRITGAFGRLLEPSTLRQIAFALSLVIISALATRTYMKLDGKNSGGGSQSPAIASATPSPQAYSAGALSVAHNPPHVARPAKRAVSRPSTPDRDLPDQDLRDRESLNRQIVIAEHEYQKAIVLLERTIARQCDRLDPELIKQYESSLALIDESINESRGVLRKRPGDPTAGQFLLAAYAKKLDLMQDIAMK